jgi:hypothetical protein
MPFLTLGQAAKESGKQKSTILDAIRSGRLSASKDDKNQWQIDPSELFRVYPAQHQTEHITERLTTLVEHNTTPAQMAKLLENEQLERGRERSMLKEQIDLLKDQVAREREQADHWRNQATMLLTHQPETPKTEQPTRSRLYEKLFRRKS